MVMPHLSATIQVNNRYGPSRRSPSVAEFQAMAHCWLFSWKHQFRDAQMSQEGRRHIS